MVLSISIFTVASLIAISFFLSARFMETKAGETNAALMRAESAAEIIKNSDSVAEAERALVGHFSEAGSRNGVLMFTFAANGSGSSKSETEAAANMYLYISFDEEQSEAGGMIRAHICAARGRKYPFIKDTLETCPSLKVENVLYHMDVSTYVPG